MRTILAFLSLLIVSLPLRAAEDPAHAELRALRTEIIDAITRGDIDTVLKHVHPDVVITWQDNQVCRGRDGLKAFFEKSGKRTFKGYKIPPTPDGLTLLHGGDTGISTGETVASYSLLGKEHEMRSRWTATLVKQEGQWLLAGYHLSMNVLDNPLLNTAKNSLYLASGVALLLGAGIGMIVAKRRRA
ncbi:MAG: nuclear transport factor 2 family protein [Verrucomicrobiota bacterium]